jgi:hypothetical protein
MYFEILTKHNIELNNTETHKALYLLSDCWIHHNI